MLMADVQAFSPGHRHLHYVIVPYSLWVMGTAEGYYRFGAGRKQTYLELTSTRQVSNIVETWRIGHRTPYEGISR